MSPILNYEEITPCLRDVTKEWEDMINDPNRPHIQFNHQTLLKCVQQGLSIHDFILLMKSIKACSYCTFRISLCK